MSEILIEAQGLSSGYGKMAVVREVDLRVAAGEVVALIGANGAGKTTTLLTLAGELAPMEGEVARSQKLPSARIDDLGEPRHHCLVEHLAPVAGVFDLEVRYGARRGQHAVGDRLTLKSGTAGGGRE